MKKDKVVTFLVLLWLVYGIFNLDLTNLWDLSVNWISFTGFIVFIVYLIYSLKKAAREKELQ